MLLKQDVRILDNVVKLGVNRYFELIEQNKFAPTDFNKPTQIKETIEPSVKIVEKNDGGLRGELWRRLTNVWIDFESRLNQIPFIERMNRGKLRIEDYRLLLLNLRQQVVEGARWISRAASNITAEIFPLRSVFTGHASEEHRDFQMLERDFVAVGGSLEEIQTAEKTSVQRLCRRGCFTAQVRKIRSICSARCSLSKVSDSALPTNGAI